MIVPDGDVIVDTETSCSKEVAVAKLLGWMQGPIRRANILLAADGSIPEEQLAAMHSLPMPLVDLLAEFRNTARQKLQDAFDAGATDDVMQMCGDAVAREDERIQLAATYFRDIDEELAKGDVSELKTDPRTTDDKGEPYLRIDSIDRWAQVKYAHRKLAPGGADVDRPVPHAAIRAGTHPWDIPEPGDPKPDQPWYTPARYFARQLIEKHPHLRDNRELLASKVVQKLTGVGIYKRGGKEQLKSGTVLKAFSNVVLG